MPPAQQFIQQHPTATLIIIFMMVIVLILGLISVLLNAPRRPSHLQQQMMKSSFETPRPKVVNTEPFSPRHRHEPIDRFLKPSQRPTDGPDDGWAQKYDPTVMGPH